MDFEDVRLIIAIWALFVCIGLNDLCARSCKPIQWHEVVMIVFWPITLVVIALRRVCGKLSRNLNTKSQGY